MAPERMAHDGHFLVLDQGSHAGKALIFDAHGEVVASAERPVATQQPQAGWVEHDAEEIVATLRDAIIEAHRTSELGKVRLAGCGLAIQRSSVVCWDLNSGAPLSPVLSWQDRRNAKWLEAQAFDAVRLREITGLVASPHYGASKLRWCLDHLPEVQRAQAESRLGCGPLASFVLHRLLEERPMVVDPANAARTLLWDLHAQDWSEELLEASGIPRASLPRCVPSRHAFGTLRAGGLEAPLLVATGDQSAALFAWGEPDTEALFVNIGTGAFVQRVFAGTPPATEQLLQGIAWRDEKKTISVLEGTVNGAGSALQWLADQRGVDAASLARRADRWLAEIAEPPLFSNGVGGLGSPFWDPDCPIGFSANATIEAEVVAVIESIVFLLQANIEAIAAAAAAAGHAASSRIVVSGGLARLDGLCQRLADLSGLCVHRPAAFEATAHGVAWLLSGARPAHPDPARFHPGPVAALHERYLASGFRNGNCQLPTAGWFD